MSTSPHPPKRGARLELARRRRHAITIGAVIAGAVLLAGGLVAVTSSGSTGSRENTAASGMAQTGERNAMGMPVVATPGRASGVTRSGGIEVVGANWDLGTVPLLVAVRPTWTLRNTSSLPVTFGEPRAEVREGCCPGAMTLGARTLAPGGSTTLTFELSMHPGMAGPHDLAVHVPVQPQGADASQLTVGVVGDFTE